MKIKETPICPKRELIQMSIETLMFNIYSEIVIRNEPEYL